ncbi:MAG: peptide chain release factor N(5)-glutamine methyltransferase [Balneolaceae bacterium]
MADKQDTELWTVLRMLEWTTGFFKEKKIPDPRHSIEWLLADVLNCKRLDLYLQYERPLSSAELNTLRPLIKRRAGHEPLQYITGSANFMGLHIRVEPSVLIPRIETEQLVELLLDQTSHAEDEPLSLLDIGTGSGCIALAVKKFRPAWHCTGTDISDKALSVASANANHNQLDVQFVHGDLFNPGSLDSPKGGWDIIVSNPPYIAPKERAGLEPQVTEYEPGKALFHENPLDVYRSVIQYAHQCTSTLFLELNDRLAGDIHNIALNTYPSAKLYNDLDKNPRFLTAVPSS